MVNKVILQGRFTKDPEVKKTNNDVSVVSFTLAVDRDFVNKETKEREADFLPCVAWRSNADFIGKYFEKGSSCCVVGRMESRKYTDKDGNKRTTYEVNVESVYFGSSKPSSESKKHDTERTAPRTDENGYTVLDDDEQDFPF